MRAAVLNRLLPTTLLSMLLLALCDPSSHCGLGEGQEVSRVSGRWPNGQEQSFENPAVGDITA